MKFKYLCHKSLNMFSFNNVTYSLLVTDVIYNNITYTGTVPNHN